MPLDDRLNTELRQLAPSDPSGAFERVVEKRIRRGIARRAQAVALAVVVLAGTAGGFFGLTHVFPLGEPGTASGASNGLIVFSDIRIADWGANVVDDWHLYTLDPLTREVTRIGPDVVEEALYPSWSPDGTRFVFVGFASSKGNAPPEGIYVAKADGTEVQQIFEAADDQQIEGLRWSPDGALIGYELVEPMSPNWTPGDMPGWTIWTMAPDGTDHHQVTTTGREMHFSWSPDGARIVFERLDRPLREARDLVEAGTDLFIVDADGDNEMRLTDDGVSRDPSWSPDGLRIAFSRGMSGDRHIAIIGVDGSLLQEFEDASTNEAGVGFPYGNMVTWSPDGRVIAFADRAEGDVCTISTIDVEDGEIRRLVSSPSSQACPGQEGMSWGVAQEGSDQGSMSLPAAVTGPTGLTAGEPGGQLGAGLGSIAVTWFHGFPDPEHDLALVSTNDGAVTPLTSGTRVDSQAAWSPDGSTIAFWSVPRGGPPGTGIYTVPAAGGEPTLLLETDLSIWSISWSPQGDRIAFVGVNPVDGSQSDMPMAVYTMASDGSGMQQLTSEGQVMEAAWSPDGTRLAITRSYAVGERRTGNDIYVFDLETGEEQRLTNDGTAWKPSWSPDGTRIAFTSNETGAIRDADLFVINADSSGRTRLTDTPEIEEDTAWAPDGSAIAVTRFGLGEPRDCDLVLVAPDGSSERVLVDGPIDGSCAISLSWRPAIA